MKELIKLLKEAEGVIDLDINSMPEQMYEARKKLKESIQAKIKEYESDELQSEQ